MELSLFNETFPGFKINYPFTLNGSFRNAWGLYLVVDKNSHNNNQMLMNSIFKD